MRTRHWLTPLAILTLAGAVTGGAAAQDQQKPKPKRNPDVISFEEIETIRGDVGSAEDLIRRLRPKFLQVRPSQQLMGSASNPPPPGTIPTGSQTKQAVTIKVYVNNVQRGSAEVLRLLPPTGINEIRYLNPSDATSRFGINHEAGAILIAVGAPPAP